MPARHCRCRGQCNTALPRKPVCAARVDRMPNHVHVIVWPMPNHLLSDILKSWKQFTSRRAKKILNMGEEPFWQPESYDHWIRNDKEKARIARYIRNNPVAAGLCARPEDWKWSSAYCAPM
ncbi:MAG: hypothetical protein DME98_15860 [Verrucomicrobia bacterium]|nr:MAG: hypothetical protein DME98_15860 [Verrucomicrobiota bacterium]PYJ35506.1 MAG: hypothetical protein DME88_01810 [Verrucomicrobiota bacterium]